MRITSDQKVGVIWIFEWSNGRSERHSGIGAAPVTSSSPPQCGGISPRELAIQVKSAGVARPYHACGEKSVRSGWRC